MTVSDLLDRARAVRLLTCDVDGVLTDGRLYYADDGTELKVFSTLDGLGLKMLHEAGIIVAWITGSAAPAVTKRARHLSVAHVILGAENKLAPWERLCSELGLEAHSFHAPCSPFRAPAATSILAMGGMEFRGTPPPEWDQA